MGPGTGREYSGRPEDHPGQALSMSWGRLPDLLRADLERSGPGAGRRSRFIRQGWRIPILMLRLKDPLFIIGAPRSGTTFLGRCVGSLAGFSYHFEPRTIKRSVQHVYYRQWSRARAVFTFRFVYATLLSLSGRPSARFCEKTPQNCLIVPFLARAFPKAQFIHIVRDGRDAALSLLEKPWFRRSEAHTGHREPGGFLYGPYPRPGIEPDRQDEFRATSDFHRCIWLWRMMTQHALAGGRSLPSSRYLELRYEDLVVRPRDNGARLSSFLSLGPEDERSLGLALQEAHADSVGRWRTSLDPEELAVAVSEAGGLLAYLGYEVVA